MILNGKEKTLIEEKIALLGETFRSSLYLTVEQYLNGIADRKGTLEQLLPFRNWDWPQGVGLFSYWRLFEATGNNFYRDEIVKYFEGYLENGLPGKNINSLCPLLTMAFLAESQGEFAAADSAPAYYRPYIEEWSAWIMNGLPRTSGGCFQHVTAEYKNEGELWIDTVFMSLLFLAKAGQLLKREEYIREAEYQFMMHIKYLGDRKTGLMYHGWTFKDRNNFAGAFWCRGNSWLTLAVPLFLEIADCAPAVRHFLIETYVRQVETLQKLQSSNGLWHTLLDHPDSYCEISGSSAIAAGILMGVRMEILDGRYTETALRGLGEMLSNINEKGEVSNVSVGTPMGREDQEFYKNIDRAPMPYGTALMLLFLLEALKP